MEKQMPPTGLTLGKAKQYLSDNFVKYTITHVNAKAGLYFGLDVWDVSALEEVPNVNSARKRNFRLYTQGLDETAEAWWESTQGPMSPPAPPAPEPEPTFLQQAKDFLVAEAKANRIKAGELIFGDNQMERATAVVIDAAATEKRMVIKKDATGNFSMEEYTPLQDTTTTLK